MFNEENSVEDYTRDLLVKLGWKYNTYEELSRQDSDVLVEKEFEDALIRLNPIIAESPDRADEVLYRLRGLLLSVRSSGLVGANEEFSSWLRNDKTMPFGKNGEHVSIKLIDFEKPENNTFVVTKQYTIKLGQEKRPDLVLLINGIPLIIGEAKTPVRPAISWVDGAIQLEGYQKSVAGLFVPNLLVFATEGKSFRVGSVKLPIDKWGPWREGENDEFSTLEEVKTAVNSMLQPTRVLELLKNFTLFSIAKGGVKIKLMPRYQQFKAAKQIVQRVVDGKIKRGLIWHFQGSGKSLLMVYAASMLRNEPRLKNPTVLVVVDRIDLKSQIAATFNASEIANTVTAEKRVELENILKDDTRKVVITNIHLFGEANSVLNDRENIIVLVDEAHRTQEGDLGMKMRNALPNAFMFGLTGTPINKRDKNTFAAFGAKEDKNGYMDRYSFEQSLRDEATLPIYFEPRLVEMRIDKEKIDKLFEDITDEISDNDKSMLSKSAAKFGVLAKSPNRVEKVVEDIVSHYKSNIEPNGFKGQIVAFDREACHLYKQELDKRMESEESAVVMTVNSDDPDEYKELYDISDDEQAKILDRFRDPNDPLKLLVVTAKLLTGFDAPIEQVMYLDKPLKDHTLLQAICRTNRTSQNKSYGLIVDYIGIFDNVAKALDFDEKQIVNVVSNIAELKKEIPSAMQKCLDHFSGIDRDIDGYEGLLAAQDCLKNNDDRDQFASDFSYFTKHWEAVSPDPILNQYKKDYRWLSQVYESIKPADGRGKLVWHALGEKTIELIHQGVDVIGIHDDLETLILDAETLEKVDNPKKRKALELKIVWKLHQKADDPKFQELGERLEKLKEQHYQQAINSLEFLKELLKIAREIVELERETPAEPIDNTKEALTQIFLECKNIETPRIVELIVDDIDDVVKVVRFDNWQWTKNGEREVKAALRKTLLKYKLHKDQELFDKAYVYIREHY